MPIQKPGKTITILPENLVIKEFVRKFVGGVEVAGLVRLVPEGQEASSVAAIVEVPTVSGDGAKTHDQLQTSIKLSVDPQATVVAATVK